MKKLLFIFFIGFVFTSFTLFQSDTDEIIKGLKTGNAEQVATYFDSFIDLTLPQKDEIKSIGKNQAGIALKSFFEENGVNNFAITSQRESGITMYIAGKLQSKNRPFNVTLLLKNKDGKHLITSIRIN